MDAEAEMEGMFAGDDQSQEQEDATQSLTQEGWSFYSSLRFVLHINSKFSSA
jgi:hypothetical protein